jgi:hypothetical protein
LEVAVMCRSYRKAGEHRHLCWKAKGHPGPHECSCWVEFFTNEEMKYRKKEEQKDG